VTVERTDVLIVGAGLAGARCAESLRAGGHGGRIVVAGEEPHLPYERPALSKELLAGTRAARDLTLREPGFWAARDIEVRPGARTEAIDLRSRRATVAGTDIRWTTLVVATGVRARRLPGLDGLPGVHHLRTLDDAAALRQTLLPGSRLAVVGAGFVGLEVASSARSLGVDVAVVDPAPVPFERTLGPAVGALLAERVRAAGVDLRLDTPVCGVSGRGRVEALELAGGARLDCDAVLVGVGARPNAEPLAGLIDLAPDGGIPVDLRGRTAVAGVHACGDVASVHHPQLAASVRLEHWSSAATTAAATASGILGRPLRRAPVPFFWSDQFGWRIQALGHVDSSLHVTVEGDADAFVARYRDEHGTLRAAVVAGRAELLPELRHQLTEADGLALAG
jgi:3-phenylpropionate/trans-cinnamate dioxygenase ferredoxin reductase component